MSGLALEAALEVAAELAADALVLALVDVLAGLGVVGHGGAIVAGLAGGGRHVVMGGRLALFVDLVAPVAAIVLAVAAAFTGPRRLRLSSSTLRSHSVVAPSQEGRNFKYPDRSTRGSKEQMGLTQSLVKPNLRTLFLATFMGPQNLSKFCNRICPTVRQLARQATGRRSLSRPG